MRIASQIKKERMREGTYVAGTAFPHTETDTDSCSLHPDLDTHLRCCRAARRSRSHLQETKNFWVSIQKKFHVYLSS